MTKITPPQLLLCATVAVSTFMLGCDGLFVDLDELSPPSDAGASGDVEADVDSGDTDTDIPQTIAPSVLTLETTDVDPFAATLRAELEVSGDPPATERGFCIGTSPSPEEDCRQADHIDGDLFEYQFNDLRAGVEYVARAYAENSEQRVYGDDVEFGFYWQDVAIADSHSCSVGTDGTLWCWGGNSRGQLGDGTNDDRSIPTRVGDDEDWNLVTAATNHSCAIKDDGTLWCWGSATSGRLGIGSTGGEQEFPTPQRVGSDNNWQQVQGHSRHTCGLRDDRSLWCWGPNTNGRLGLGHTETQNIPRLVAADEEWIDIGIGQSHTCAIRADGTLWCWGMGNFYRLGVGDNEDRHEPTQVGSNNNWETVTGGRNYTCATRTDGSLWCWGHNSEGQLGHDDTETREEPARVGISSQWSTISAGDGFTCGLREGNELWCWGNNSVGQLGVGDTISRFRPVQVSSDHDWKVLATSGSEHFCAITDDGQLMCWGSQDAQQLGTGMNGGKKLEPVTLDTPPGVTHITAGSRHGCAVAADDTVCWGRGTGGQLGSGDRSNRPAPTPIDGDSSFEAVSAGGSHSCGLSTDDRRAHCWGTALFGALGNGDSGFDSELVSIPQAVNADSGWTSLVTGALHSCGIDDDASLWCWGSTEDGRLGFGAEDDLGFTVDSPQQVESDRNWSAISVGEEHSCRIQNDESLWCWGAGRIGRLGLGDDNEDHFFPAQVGDDGDQWTGVSTGRHHTCAIDDSRALYCWGRGDHGQLGLGNDEGRDEPTRVGGGSDWTAVSASRNHTCGLRDGQTLWCWGANLWGQLGLGDEEARNQPVRVGDEGDWIAVATGNRFTLALREDGTVAAWGVNEDGRLGDGTAWIDTPVPVPFPGD